MPLYLLEKTQTAEDAQPTYYLVNQKVADASFQLLLASYHVNFSSQKMKHFLGYDASLSCSIGNIGSEDGFQTSEYSI